MSNDRLIRRLERKGVTFSPATDEVIEGLDLKATGNRSYGKNVHVSSRSGPTFPDAALRLGRTISVGHREAFRGCELRCERAGEAITVSLHDERGRPLTRTLARVARGDDIDEGLLTWFGPVEYVGTPWSDNDDEQCQVLTVDVLRTYARSVWARQRLARVEAHMVQAIEASLTWPDVSEADAPRLPESERAWYLPLLRLGADNREAEDVATFCRWTLRGSDRAALRSLLRTQPGMRREELEAIVTDEVTRTYHPRSRIQPLTELLGWIVSMES